MNSTSRLCSTLQELNK